MLNGAHYIWWPIVFPGCEFVPVEQGSAEFQIPY